MSRRPNVPSDHTAAAAARLPSCRRWPACAQPFAQEVVGKLGSWQPGHGGLSPTGVSTGTGWKQATRRRHGSADGA